MKMTTDNN